jgi:hypothetical protein
LQQGQVARKLRTWAWLIAAGAFAYGLGLSQGSSFRMKRTIASLQRPIVVEKKAEQETKTATVSASAKPFGNSGSPKNTESPKSH